VIVNGIHYPISVFYFLFFYNKLRSSAPKALCSIVQILCGLDFLYFDTLTPTDLQHRIHLYACAMSSFFMLKHKFLHI
jgi:hypothetical protein